MISKARMVGETTEVPKVNKLDLWNMQPAWFKRIRLFLGIVWRMHEGGRMTVGCSWAVAKAMHP